MKTCNECGVAKPLDEFYFHKGQGNRYPQCKVCCRASMRARYNADPEKYRKIGRETGRTAVVQAQRRRRYADQREYLVKQSRQWKAMNPQKVAAHRATRKAKIAADPLYWRKEGLRGRGLTIETYEAMLTAQGGGCAICGGPPFGKDPIHHVDHDHATDTVRGLLCTNCNLAIGLLRDEPARCRAAAAYLESFVTSDEESTVA